MADLKQKLATSTAITITLDSLTNSASAVAGRESAAIDNGTNLYVDVLVTVTCVVGTGTPGNSGGVIVYAYLSEDGTNYASPATGSNAAIALPSASGHGLVQIGFVPIPVQSGTYKGVFSLRAALGCVPRKWGLVVVNSSGIALAASGNSASYSGVHYQSV